jgi:hypothetical protein
MQHVVQREAESQQTDPYDTHPTLGERLAAVQALPTGPQLSDDRPALSLLENVPALEDALVMHLLGQERTEALRPVAWDDIGATVYLPKWQEVARRYTAGLAGVTPTTLPTYLRSPDPLVKAIEQAAGRTLLQQETTGAVRNILGAALAAALARQGWAADASPGVPVTLRRGDRVIVSFIAVHALADGKLSPQEWQQQCQEAGIADLSLAIE